MSSEGYELLALPLETIIGSYENKTARRNSMQSDSSSINATELDEMRKKFETFLSQDELKGSLQSNLQKLLFLDYFYDVKRKKACKLQQDAIVQSCNWFLASCIQVSNNESLVNPENDIFLVKLEKMVEENPKLFTIIIENETLRSWLETQLELITNPKPAKQDETQEDDQLEMLVYMFSNHFKYKFYYFQKTESKFVHDWMKLNLSSLPRFILDELKVKHETRQSLRELLAYKENELNSSTILDADFELFNFLSSNTGDWKLLSNLSKISDIQVFTSNENYMCTPKSKIIKMVYNVGLSIEEFTKAWLSYKYPKEGNSREYIEYVPMVSNNSSRKYACVKGTVTIASKIPLVDDRVSDAVYTSRPKFIGNRLVETMELLKTTSSLKDNTKCITIAGVIIRKVDERKCQVVEMYMTYLSGILQTDLVMEKILLKLYVSQIIGNESGRFQ